MAFHTRHASSCSSSPQAPPLPIVPNVEAKAQSPFVAVLASLLFFTVRNVFLCSFLFQNGKANRIRGRRGRRGGEGHTVFLRPDSLQPPPPLGISVGEGCRLELLFLLDHYFPTKRIIGRHGSKLSGNNNSKQFPSTYCMPDTV